MASNGLNSVTALMMLFLDMIFRASHLMTIAAGRCGYTMLEQQWLKAKASVREARWKRALGKELNFARPAVNGWSSQPCGQGR